MQLFYIDDLSSDIYTLSAEESKHVVRVLRMMVDDRLCLTDGRGTLCSAVIVVADPRACVVQVVEREAIASKPFRLHVAVAPTKNEARLEWFVEKATEVGIDAITPLLCDHSERRHLHEERLDKIVVSAMKQSLKAYKPQVHALTKIDDLILAADAEPEMQKFICYCDGDVRVPLQSVYRKGSSALILIGPEGDFSPREVELALVHGFLPITLGTCRLRTETAALAATFYLNFLNE